MGQRIKNANFQYLSAEDLPVIFSELYEFNRLEEKGCVRLKKEAIDEIALFMNNTSKIIYNFYDEFIKTKNEFPDNTVALDDLIIQLFSYLHNNLHNLSDKLGFRYIAIESSSITDYSRAYVEVISLSYFMGEEFKKIWDSPKESDGELVSNNVLSTFDAIDKIVQKYSGFANKIDYRDFLASCSMRNMLQTDNMEQIIKAYNEQVYKIINAFIGLYPELEKRLSVNTNTNAPEINLNLEKCNGEVKISFKEESDNKGDIILDVSGEKTISDLKIVECIDVLESKNLFAYTLDDKVIKKLSEILKNEFEE